MITSRENGRRSEGHGWTAGLFLVIGFFMASLMGRVFAADMPLPGAEIIPSQVDEPSLSNQPENLTGTPQSAPNWRYAHTPMKVRLAFFIGDQAGGPVRFNSRFPEVKSDPHPASYFHTLPMVGGELEYAMKWGGVLVGALFRRDVWHPGIKGRSLIINQQTWAVDDFSLNSSGLVFGWVFGERYREAPWTADIAFVYDRGSADTTLSEASGTTAIGQVGIDALTLRSRLQFNLRGSNALNFSAGPDFHVPVWQSMTDQSDAAVKTWLASHLELKSSASIGFSLMSNYRF
jgi:hypothetical protein